MGEAAVVAAGIATGVQPPNAAVVARAWGAGPLGGGTLVEVGNLESAGDGQGGALYVGIGAVQPQLGEGQGKDGAFQGAHRIVGPAEGVVKLGGANNALDVSVQHVYIGVVKPAIQVADGVGVHIATIPHPGIIHVLADHQGPPGAIKFDFIVVFGNIEVHHITVFI